MQKIFGIDIRISPDKTEWYDIFLTAPDKDDNLLASCADLPKAKHFAACAFSMNIERILENTKKGNAT